MTKVSKAARARVRRANGSEKASIRKSARILADYDLITQKRFGAIVRASRQGGSTYK